MMSCKNTCLRLIGSTAAFRVSRPYENGFQYCRRCEYYLKAGGTHCPCCLTPDELVYTSNGVAAISEIKEGDHVLDHRGQYARVTEKFEHDYEGYIYKVKVNGHKPITVTEEHPIFVYDNEGGAPQKLVHIRTAKHIKKGDFLVFGKGE